MTVYFGFIILGQQKPTGGLQVFIYIITFDTSGAKKKKYYPW